MREFGSFHLSQTPPIMSVLNSAPVPVDWLCDNVVNGFCRLKRFLSLVPNLTKEAMYLDAGFGNSNITNLANGQPILS